MVSDFFKWEELRVWAHDKSRLGSEEDSVFFMILLSKMSQIDSKNKRTKFSMQRGTLQDMYPDMPFDGEDF